MDELEEKARTLLVGRTAIPESAQRPAARCAVDGCLHPATVTCDVSVANRQLNPAGETHRVHLCRTHEAGFASLKWQWRRRPDADSTRLTLDGVFAPDVAEDK